MSSEQIFDNIPFPITRQDASAILRWYMDAGVDIAIGDNPIDRTVLPPPRTEETPFKQEAARPRQQQNLPPVRPALPSHQAGPTAAELAASADSLEALKAAMESFTGCPLKRMATQTVFGNGPADAKLMVIGEAPGADEDRSGTPFVGRAGQLLNKMLASIGLPREQVFVTNVIPWRPPGNRTPTPEEVTTCLPFALRSIDLIKPQAILLLGGSSASAILGTKEGITRIRGKWKELKRPETEGNAEHLVQAMATFHPAYLLRFPAKKSFAWNDLLLIKKHLSE